MTGLAHIMMCWEIPRLPIVALALLNLTHLPVLFWLLQLQSLVTALYTCVLLNGYAAGVAQLCHSPQKMTVWVKSSAMQVTSMMLKMCLLPARRRLKLG